LQQAAAAGVQQYVILGAGLDTFPLRQPRWATGLRIFEVYHPATQEWKWRLLVQAKLQMPSNVRYCPVDFERTSLRDGLLAASFSAERPAFFSWLGVTQYLAESAIHSTLGFVATLPSPSGIVFTFVLPDEDLEPTVASGVAALAERAAAGGEPFITRLQPKA